LLPRFHFRLAMLLLALLLESLSTRLGASLELLLLRMTEGIKRD
jgi:hypothetical protein